MIIQDPSITLEIKSMMVQNKKAEIDFFDKFGVQLDYDVFDEKGYKRIIDEFLQYFTITPGMKVLDFGCGTGAFTARFSSFPFELYGIDISSECIRYASKKYPTINFKTGDVEHTGFENDTFDIVLMSGLLHHFPDFFRVVSEAKRILKPGGKILAYDPNRANPVMWLYRCKQSPFYSAVGVTENEQPLSKKALMKVFKKVGFSDLKAYSVSGITYKYVESKSAGKFLPVYNFLENLFDRTFLRNYIGSFLITYAKK
jgi:ubiquinone/menaquinone biosynthesis C-methylase UbiE